MSFHNKINMGKKSWKIMSQIQIISINLFLII